MNNIRCSILRSNDIKNLEHIIQYSIPPCSTIVVMIPTNKMLDLRESFFNGIEIRRIRWQELDANTKSID